MALVPGDGLADLASAVRRRRRRAAPVAGAGHRGTCCSRVQQAHAREVVVLPNDRDTVAVAEAAAE